MRPSYRSGGRPHRGGGRCGPSPGPQRHMAGAAEAGRGAAAGACDQQLLRRKHAQLYCLVDNVERNKVYSLRLLPHVRKASNSKHNLLECEVCKVFQRLCICKYSHSTV